MDRFRGFFKENAPRVKNTNGNHDQIAADISVVLGTPTYAPFTEDNSIVKFRVIRVNNDDQAMNNVRYSAIQDISHTHKIEFWYFHTDKSPLKVGQLIESGALVCYTAKNGIMTGPHLHLEGRQGNGTKHVNPTDCMAIMNGGENGILLGIPKPETCEQKLAKLEKQIELLNLEIAALNSEKAIMQKTIDEQAKKLSDIKAIVC